MKPTLLIALVLALGTSALCWADDPSVHFTIDATKNVLPISRYIYGVNRKLEGDWAGLPMTRVGGNRLTAYNWTNNASNAGSDWQYQNDNGLGKSDTPGEAYASAIENASANHAGIVITVPINGYVAADKKGGGDVHKSGTDYLKTRFRPEEPAKGSAFTLTPDPSSPVVYQDEMVNWIKTKYPYCLADPVRPVFFDLDNEPDLWQSTHREVHPKPATYAELVEKSVAYSKAIKAVMPKAKIFGAVNYGWAGYQTLQNAPDAKGRDFQEFFLSQMRDAEKAAGRRLVDVLDIHWYPEAYGGGKRVVASDSSPAVAAARIQCTRSLWDPTYKEDSWIARDSTHGPIALLPLMHKKIDANYPGTLLALTEYNYGGGGHISGGIAEADVLGIFGRQNVFAAAEWPMAKDESFIAGGMKMFRDFDGKGAVFGDTSVSATTDNVPDTSIYAGIDSTDRGRMVLVAINKTDKPITAAVTIEHASSYKTTRVFQLTSGNATPQAATAVSFDAPGKCKYEMPPFSVSTIELAAR